MPVLEPDGGTREWVGSCTDVTERKTAEEALRLSQERLALALKAGRSGTFEWDIRNNINLWSPEIEELYGLPPGGFGGKYESWEALLVPEDLASARQAIQESLRSGEFAGEWRIRQPSDGEIRWLGARARVLFDEAGKPQRMIGINTDITDRKRAETALAYERQRFAAVLDKLPVMVCLLAPDYSVRFANQAFRREFGEAKGRKCYQYCFGLSQPCEFCQTFDVLKTGVPHDWEITTPKGTRIHAFDFPFTDSDGSPLILEMDIDVTREREAEESLRKASRYARSLIEASLDPLVTISKEGKITDVNQATEQVTGVQRSELIGSDFCDYFTAPEKARQGYQRVFAEGHVRDYQLAIRSRSGLITDVMYNATLFQDERGEVQGIFAAARDVTERNRAEQEIRRLNAELEDRVAGRTAELATTVKDLEAFTYSVSHDLRAPLRQINGFAKLLVEDFGPSLDSKAQEYLRWVQDGTRRMGQLVDDLLNLSRVGRRELRPQLAGMSSLVKEATEDLAQETQGRQIEWQIGDLPFLECDASLMKQVWANLLSNAVKFTRTRKPARIQVGQEEREGRKVLFVRDNGVGFSMKYADKLFGVFQRLHREEDFEGTGVGLATVQRIIQKHGGRIWAEAELDKGAAFYFTLGETAVVHQPNGRPVETAAAEEVHVA